jgi:hypothetical protein
VSRYIREKGQMNSILKILINWPLIPSYIFMAFKTFENLPRNSRRLVLHQSISGLFPGNNIAEILQQLQAERLALFRVELHGEYIVLPDR